MTEDEQVHRLEEQNEQLRARVAEMESRLAFLGGTRHIIDVVYGGWTIQHTLVCRPNLFDCEVNEAALAADTFPKPGRYFCRVDGGGDLVVEEAVAVI